MEHGDVAMLVDQPRVNGHRPSVDVLFHSVAQEFGSKSVAVLMTGMGDDGAAGMGAVQAAGGFTIAQSPEPASSTACRDRPSSAASPAASFRCPHWQECCNPSASPNVRTAAAIRCSAAPCGAGDTGSRRRSS